MLFDVSTSSRSSVNTLNISILIGFGTKDNNATSVIWYCFKIDKTAAASPLKHKTIVKLQTTLT